MTKLIISVVALATGLPIWALEGGAIGERLQGVDRATVLPGDISVTKGPST